MTVYIVFCSGTWALGAYTDIKKVFSTRPKAEEFIEQQPHSDDCSYYIEQYEMEL